MMKQLLTILTLILFLPVYTHAQEESDFIPVDWKEIKKVAENDPQKINDLVARMAASEIDTTMTWNERILAYYGLSFLKPFSGFSEGRKLNELFEEGKYEECLSRAKELLKENPLSLEALSNAGLSIGMMLEDSTHHHDVTEKEAKEYFTRMFIIFSTIARTGDGTSERPFSVTMVSDEYMFMHYHLDIWEFESQYLTGNKCDGFDLKEPSEEYPRKQIFFDVSRVLEIEREMFLK
jgi:hypothetical protein